MTPYPFRILRGGLHQSLIVKGVKFIAAPRHHPPCVPEAEVFEEDSFLIMSDEPAHAPPTEHPIRIMRELEKFTPEVPGTVVLKGHHPTRMLAVIHDVNREPTWKEEWIEKAICSVFNQSERLKIQTIALPMLGTQHGRLKHPRFGKLLAKALNRSKFEHIRIVWIIAPVPVNKAIIDILKKRTGFE